MNVVKIIVVAMGKLSFLDNFFFFIYGYKVSNLPMFYLTNLNILIFFIVKVKLKIFIFVKI